MAYHNEIGTFPEQLNAAFVEIERIDDAQDAATIRVSLVRHVEKAGSAKAAAALDSWSA
ncbi:MAG: hypothetical protein ACOC9Y_08645 [Chloroflexota bacterium]